MQEITDEQFSAMISDVMDELPRDHMDAVKNVAIVYADEPTDEQRVKLQLRNDQSLFGLYEGIPLSKRQGMTSYAPDKITIFKDPILHYVSNWGDGSYTAVRAQVKRTVWHEIAHYFGLDHPAIHALENKKIDG